MIDRAGDAGVWRRILDQGEHVLWQGQPASPWALRPADLFQIASGMVLIGGAVIFTIADLNSGSPGFFVLAMLVLGLWSIFVPALAGVIQRRYSFYTLTNRRVFIGRDVPILGRSLKSWPIIGPNVQLEQISHDNGLGTVLFATTASPWYARRRQNVPVGFEYIADAPRVFALMSDLQRTTT